MSMHQCQQVPGAPPHLLSTELSLAASTEVCSLRQMLETKCNYVQTERG